MEQARLFMAIALSFLIFFLWNVFFVEKEMVEPPPAKTLAPIIKMEEGFGKKEQLAEKEEVKPVKTARTIQVNTPLYTVKIAEKRSAIKSFVLKRYREQIELDSPLKEIVSKNMPDGTLLMGFAGKSIPGLDRAVFSADLPYDSVDIVHGSEPLIFSWVSPNGIVVKKELSSKALL